MKRISFIIILALIFFQLTGQRLVNPNRPANPAPGNRIIALIELKTGIGSSDSSQPYTGIFYGADAVVGYQATRNFMAGLGAGVSFYKDGMLVPFYLDLRYIINSRFIEPYLFADGGLLFDTKNLDESKVFMNPGLGARYSIKKRIDIMGGAGLFFQTGNTDQNVFLSIKAGAAFRF